jgi:hypothetical protein
MSYGSGPCLLGEVSSGAATCPMAPDLTSWLRWAPMLSCVSRFPVGCGPQAQKSLAGLLVQLGTHVPNACAHISIAPNVRDIMGLQDVWAGAVIMTCKSCGHALQYCATVHHRATDRSRARWAQATTRQDGATLQTALHMARPIGWGTPCAARTIITLYQHLMP